ncbi:hypothetical protein [Acinetobacter pittii]|uniref:hypothetical protein n=1 Tax=Acinetobacter pittii TaxID=48296 RepID=UPI000F74B3CD|nr:hypothetical protein [Acinetobacter pittii]RSO48428.1 hypothetical protein EA757_07015 [Acinetobacter pittii]RSO77818.1 hypothetical protein EA753_07925 [Acinetobacter pittii]
MQIDNTVLNQYAQFQWLARGLTAQSLDFTKVGHSSGNDSINYQDRLGAIAKMKSQLAKSVTALIIFDGKSESDYEYIRNHLAQLMLNEAAKDKKREPEHIALYHLAWLMARMIIDFSFSPELEKNFTAQGRLYYAGIAASKMSVDVYRMTWKPYEKLMQMALETALSEAEETIREYRKNTYKELQS